MKKYNWLAFILMLLITENASAQNYNPDDQLRLLSCIDLNRSGLEKVKLMSVNGADASVELLKYFRSRDFVKHPVERTKKGEMKGKAASSSELVAAENALKHIFVGQSAYPAFFCGNDINWNMRPVPDNEWVWQLNRMGFWQALSVAYWHTGDEKYAREWCYQLRDWALKNPRDKKHDYAWRSIEAGIRGYNWTNLFQRFLDSPSFTPDILIVFLNTLHEHASFLMTRYSKGSNWALMEAEGLNFIAFTFPEFRESAIWRDEAIQRLNAEITNQVYPDGHQRELAMGYHNGCIGWFTRSYDLAMMNGITDAFPASYGKMIEKMSEVSLKLGFPDGTNPQFGDSWTGNPGHLWPGLLKWADQYNREDFRYVATEGKMGTRPAGTAFALEKSGLYSMRSGWDKNDICLVLKCGPDGGGHCQPDNGTFELYAGGRHLMPDAGSYIYSGDPENRAWFRQTKVHQTLTLNGKNSKYAPKLLLWKPGENHDILVVENKSYAELTHRRAVLFVNKKFFVIIDEAIGSDTGKVDVHFQLAPGKVIFDEKTQSARSDFNDWNVLVRAEKQKNMEFKEEEGQVSFLYTKKEPRPAFRYGIHKKSTEDVRIVSIVVPFENESPDIKVRFRGKTEVGASSMKLRVSVNGKPMNISYSFKMP